MKNQFYVYVHRKENGNVIEVYVKESVDYCVSKAALWSK